MYFDLLGQVLDHAITKEIPDTLRKRTVSICDFSLDLLYFLKIIYGGDTLVEIESQVDLGEIIFRNTDIHPSGAVCGGKA